MLPPSTLLPPSVAYNPVYNIREIRTVCNSFSSLGIDKKLLEVERTSSGSSSGRHSIGGCVGTGTTGAGIVMEVVNNNPAKGYGNFVYI